MGESPASSPVLTSLNVSKDIPWANIKLISLHQLLPGGCPLFLKLPTLWLEQTPSEDRWPFISFALWFVSWLPSALKWSRGGLTPLSLCTQVNDRLAQGQNVELSYLWSRAATIKCFGKAAALHVFKESALCRALCGTASFCSLPAYGGEVVHKKSVLLSAESCFICVLAHQNSCICFLLRQS